MDRVLAAVRAGVPLALVVAGVLVAVAWKSSAAPGAAVLLIGSAAIVLLLNWLFRLGVSGDRERAVEEAARRHYDAHGRWPGE